MQSVSLRVLCVSACPVAPEDGTGVVRKNIRVVVLAPSRLCPPQLLPNGVSSAFFLDFNDSDNLLNAIWHNYRRTPYLLTLDGSPTAHASRSWTTGFTGDSGNSG